MSSSGNGVARGAFIVIEGLDRAGKSTQVSLLAKSLDARSIKFPERSTAIGSMIDMYLTNKSELDDRAVHLLFSANRWEASNSILHTLASGRHVVCDRYAFSGIAYSVAKGLEYEWCRAPDVGLPAPDLTIFLNLSAEETAKRGGYGEERYEAIPLQTRVRQVFEKFPKDAGITHSGVQWKVIDASQSMEDVSRDCQRAAAAVIESVQIEQQPLGSLFSLSKDAIQ